MQKFPPFAAVRAFEAAARHASFKAAAIELGVTSTAISHQIRQLEERVGRPLFVRRPRAVELTDDGEQFAESIRPALDEIATAFVRLCDRPVRETVTLGAGPIFASRHLVPRLGEFWSANPDIDLRLHHSPLPVWQCVRQFDLAVAWGDGNWPGVICDPLLRINVTPVVAPGSVLAQSGMSNPEDLLSLPLLHHRNGNGWRQWFRSVGVQVTDELPGTVFEDANVLLQATLSGRGIALGILEFIGDDIASGRLMPPFPQSVDPGDSYFLIHSDGALKKASTGAVRDWIMKG